jgi:poly-gamma-glutamate synthesis protein (capsule biosynthesis protein)
MVEYLGVNVVNLATNHVIDRGLVGMLITRDLFESRGALTLGLWQYPESHGVRLMEIEGLRLAFVGFTYSLNGLTLPDWQGWQVGMLWDREQMQRDVLWAKEQADLVIVSLHWGDEDRTTPNAEQRELIAFFADLGVDLILGHHPHVLQPVEVVERSDGQQMTVFYSLGNFISNQIAAPNMLGGMAVVELVLDSDGARVATAGLIPLVTHFSQGFARTYVYPLAEYTAAMAAQHGILAYDTRFTLDWLHGFLRSVVSEEFIMD